VYFWGFGELEEGAWINNAKRPGQGHYFDNQCAVYAIGLELFIAVVSLTFAGTATINGGIDLVDSGHHAGLPSWITNRTRFTYRALVYFSADRTNGLAFYASVASVVVVSLSSVTYVLWLNGVTIDSL